MVIKLHIQFPQKVRVRKTIKIEVQDGLVQTEVEAWVRKNKRKILKENGCNLTEDELQSGIRNADVNIYPIF